jgi:hypothetical protein
MALGRKRSKLIRQDREEGIVGVVFVHGNPSDRDHECPSKNASRLSLKAYIEIACCQANVK